MTPKSILYLQRSNPGAYPPVVHSTRILADAGWEVLHLGLEMPHLRSLRLAEHPNVEHSEVPFSNSVFGRATRDLQFLAQALRIIYQKKPAFLYISDNAITPVAMALHKLVKIPMIYHEHDCPEGSLGWRAKAWRYVHENALLRIFPNETRGHHTNLQLGQELPFETVWNCCAQIEAMEVEKSNDTIKLLYHGSIVPSRLPLTIVDAIKRAPENLELDVIGYETQGGIGHCERVDQYAKSIGCESQIRFHGPKTRAEILQFCDEAHIGFSLFQNAEQSVNETNMCGASVKVFEYLARGVLPIVNAHDDWQRHFEHLHLARTCDPKDADSVAQTLAEAIKQVRTSKEPLLVKGPHQIRKLWNYEMQFAPILTFLNSDH